MESVSTAQARLQLSTLVNRAAFGKERIILERRGKAIAALVPLEDLKLLEALGGRIGLQDARAALAEVEKEGTISWEKIKADLGL